MLGCLIKKKHNSNICSHNVFVYLSHQSVSRWSRSVDVCSIGFECLKQHWGSRSITQRRRKTRVSIGWSIGRSIGIRIASGVGKWTGSRHKWGGHSQTVVVANERLGAGGRNIGGADQRCGVRQQTRLGFRLRFGLWLGRDGQHHQQDNGELNPKNGKYIQNISCLNNLTLETYNLEHFWFVSLLRVNYKATQVVLCLSLIDRCYLYDYGTDSWNCRASTAQIHPQSIRVVKMLQLPSSKQ